MQTPLPFARQGHLLAIRYLKKELSPEPHLVSSDRSLAFTLVAPRQRPVRVTELDSLPAANLAAQPKRRDNRQEGGGLISSALFCPPVRGHTGTSRLGASPHQTHRRFVE